MRETIGQIGDLELRRASNERTYWYKQSEGTVPEAEALRELGIDPSQKQGEYQAIWRNKDSDIPVTVVGFSGRENDEDYLKIAGSNSGIARRELKFTSSEPEADKTGLSKEEILQLRITELENRIEEMSRSAERQTQLEMRIDNLAKTLELVADSLDKGGFNTMEIRQQLDSGREPVRIETSVDRAKAAVRSKTKDSSEAPAKEDPNQQIARLEALNAEQAAEISELKARLGIGEPVETKTETLDPVVAQPETPAAETEVVTKRPRKVVPVNYPWYRRTWWNLRGERPPTYTVDEETGIWYRGEGEDAVVVSQAEVKSSRGIGSTIAAIGGAALLALGIYTAVEVEQIEDFLGADNGAAGKINPAVPNNSDGRTVTIGGKTIKLGTFNELDRHKLRQIYAYEQRANHADAKRDWRIFKAEKALMKRLNKQEMAYLRKLHREHVLNHGHEMLAIHGNEFTNGKPNSYFHPNQNK